MAKKAYYLNALVLNKTVETPFGATPCLCWSQEIEVTPSKVKSNLPKSTPWSLANTAVNPPKQASTCNPIFFLFAIPANYSIGSYVPYGKLGNEPTIQTVLLSILLFRSFTSTVNVV